MNTVFLDQQTFDSSLDFSVIRNSIENFTSYPLTSKEQILTRCKNQHIIITNKVVLDKSILQQLPDLKLICIAATGSNNIDLNAAKELGIAVTNVAGYARHSVGQYVFAMLLEHFNHSAHFINNTRTNKWQNSATFCQIDKPITELSCLTLGVIGYGSLGKQVHTLASAFGMKVLIAEHQGSTNIRTGRSDFEHVLAHSDVISLHCPLTPNTDRLMNKQTLAKMKKGAVLVNSARGQIVDSHALIEALTSGHLGAAIIDVLEQEPPTAQHPLITNKLDNLYVTAHIAWGSIQAQQRLINAIGENIASYLQGKTNNRLV